MMRAKESTLDSLALFYYSKGVSQMSNSQFAVATPNVSLRFSQDDKAALAELSRRMQRSQSEVLRLLVRAGLEILNEADVIEGEETGSKIAVAPNSWAAHQLALAGQAAGVPGDVARVNLMKLRSVGEKIQGAEAGDPAMIQWVRRNARWVLAYRNFIQGGK